MAAKKIVAERFERILKQWGEDRVIALSSNPSISMPDMFRMYCSECGNKEDLTLPAFRYTISNCTDWRYARRCEWATPRDEKAQILYSYLPKERIRSLLRDDHSFGMIYDLLQRDHSEFFKHPAISDNKQALGNILKSQGLGFDVAAYNSRPQVWKLQYRYSPEEVSKMAADGQKKTAALRKASNGAYNPRLTLEYWEERASSSEEAGKLLMKHKRENSPLCEEFYLSRGMPEEEVKERISAILVSGALATLKKAQQPKTEKFVAEILGELGIAFSPQFAVKTPPRGKALQAAKVCV